MHLFIMYQCGSQCWPCPVKMAEQSNVFKPLLKNIIVRIIISLRKTVAVTGHRSNTLDNQYGATITNSSVSGASLPRYLCANVQRKVNN